MTYCDSSFLTSLYVNTDVSNRQARKERARFSRELFSYYSTARRDSYSDTSARFA